MNSRVKTIAVGAVLAGVTALVGCGSNGGVGGGGDVEQNTGDTSTITYWTWFPPEATLTSMIAAFEEANPNITVNLKTFTNEDYQKQLPLALSGGEDIDVVGVQISAMTNAVKDYLHPVSDWGSDLLGNVNANMVAQTEEIASDGVLYSIPMGSIGSPIMYYNKAILDKAGVAVPRTSAEWKQAVEAIKKSSPDVTPVAFTGDPWWQEEMLFAVAEQTSPGMSDSIFHGDGAWDQPAVVDALAAYKSLFDDGVIGTDVLSLQGSRASELFSAGKAAFYLDGSWSDSLLSADARAAGKISVDDVGATTLPLVSGGKPAVRAFAEGGLAIPSTSKNVKAATAFITFVLSAEGADTWAKDLILVPSLNDYTLPDGVLTSDAAKTGYTEVNAAIAAPTSKRDSNQDFLNKVEGNAILDVLRGTTSPEDAAAKMQSEWTSGRYPHGTSK